MKLENKKTGNIKELTGNIHDNPKISKEIEREK